MSKAVVEATDATFDEEVLNSDLPVVVDFWASWCGPCMMFKPIVEKVAEEMKDKVKVVLVEVDRNAQSASKYNVMGVPTVLIFKDGQVKVQSVGALGEEDLKKKIEEVIG